MRGLSYLRMEVDPSRIEDYEEDLEEMIWMARMTPGFLGVEVFRKRSSTNLAGTSVLGTSPRIHREFIVACQYAGTGVRPSPITGCACYRLDAHLSRGSSAPF
jgi:hypothetical protein